MLAEREIVNRSWSVNKFNIFLKKNFKFQISRKGSSSFPCKLLLFADFSLLDIVPKKKS